MKILCWNRELSRSFLCRLDFRSQIAPSFWYSTQTTINTLFNSFCIYHYLYISFRCSSQLLLSFSFKSSVSWIHAKRAQKEYKMIVFSPLLISHILTLILDLFFFLMKLVFLIFQQLKFWFDNLNLLQNPMRWYS